MKICSKCKQEKPLTSEYWHKSKTKDGFQNQCKVCRNQYNSQKQKEKWADGLGKQKIKESNKKYYEANRDKILERMTTYRETENYKESFDRGWKKWALKNKGKINAYHAQYTRQYKRTDKGRMIVNISNYKSKARFKYGSIIDEFCISDWYNCKKYFNNQCAYCGVNEDDDNKLIMEHLTPLSKSQDFTKKNIVCSCHKCNVKKKQMTLEEFFDFWNKPKNFTQERYDRILEYIKRVDLL